MKKSIFTIILASTLFCFCASCRDNENENNGQKFDLNKFSEIAYNKTILRVNDNTRELDGCVVERWCSGYYILKVYNEEKQEILSFNFHPENYTLGDKIAAIPTIDYYEDKDTISYNYPNNAAIQLYHHKRKNIDADTDSVYIDAVFHIKVNGDIIKDIKGQIKYKGEFDLNKTLLCE